MAYCKNCGVEVIGQFCAECGTSKGVGNNFCGGCGGQNDKPDWKFCVHCGEKNTVAAAPSANACSCGQVFLPNTRFCASCGEPRPGLGNSGDSGPAPGVPKRRVAPPPPLPGKAPSGGLNSSNEIKISPRGNGWNQQQTVEVSAPQPWSPPRSAPTPINTTSNNYNTAPAAASSPVYNSSPSQFAIPTPPPQPVKEEKKKKSLKDKLKAKLVGGGWLLDKNAPPKPAAADGPKSPKSTTTTTTAPKPISTSPSNGGGNVTNNRILEHIQKSYNDPAPNSSQMSTSPRNASPVNNFASSPPTRPAVTPVVNNTTPPPPPSRPAVTTVVNTVSATPPPPPKTTPAATPAKPKEELIPKKEGDVVLLNSSFGKQPAAKPIQKVHVPAPPPGIKNKDNRMSLNTILAESTNYDGSAYQATIVSHEDRADAVDTSKKVTLYKIAVAQGGKNWAVFRRVAQFEELDKRLKKKGALGPNEGSLKKKSKDKDQMLQELEKYLVFILSKADTAGHHYVHNFLQPTQLGDIKAT